jgi:hypothetical protein
MIVVNMIDKDRIRGDEGFGDSKAVWRARLFLFIGFALMAGGLAGSVVSCLSFFFPFFACNPGPLSFSLSIDTFANSPTFHSQF